MTNADTALRIAVQGMKETKDWTTTTGTRTAYRAFYAAAFRVLMACHGDADIVRAAMADIERGINRK